MTSLPRIAGAAAAVLAAVLLAAASSVPLQLQRSPEATVRVAFSARPERLETCHEMDADELAALPQHMRQSVVCEGRTASYELQVWHNETLVASSELHGGGLRRDRQLYALQEVLVPAGTSTIEVRLTRVDSLDTGAASPAVPDTISTGGAIDPARVAREADERRRRMEGEVPPLLVLREVVELEPREVVLVTYDQSERQLRTMRNPE